MSAEACAGCEHTLDGHVTAVTGKVVCLVRQGRYSHSGVIGAMPDYCCDCVDYHSEVADRRRATEKHDREERERRSAEFVAKVKEQMALPSQPVQP